MAQTRRMRTRTSARCVVRVGGEALSSFTILPMTRGPAAPKTAASP